MAPTLRGLDTFNTIHQMEEYMARELRDEIDADILRRITELTATQPITNNHRGLFRFEQPKDERSDDDQYLGRIGVRI